MAKRIVIIDGHPDPDPARFCHMLADTYAAAAEAAGHEVRQIVLSQIEIPVLRTRQDWEHGEPSDQVRQCQQAVGWAGHLVVIYPLWLGSMPALLKAFFEQVFRPGFAIAAKHDTLWPGMLTGKSARVVVTMGMPALAYRWFYLAHSLKSLERNILRFSGIGPIRESLIGNVEGSADARAKWLDTLAGYGREGR